MNADERDFRLTLDTDPETHELRVALYRCAEGKSDTLLSEATTPAFAASLQKDYLDPLEDSSGKSLPHNFLRDFGRELAERLLPDGIRARLLAARIPSTTRLRLTIAPACSLLGLPWEFLYVDADRSGMIKPGFLCQRPDFHLIRQPFAPRFVLPILANPLNVLVAWADPKADGFGALPFLKSEVRAIETVCMGAKPGPINVQKLENATVPALEKVLCTVETAPHILHFIGHGEAGKDGNALILQGEQGAVRLPLHTLASWLRGTSVRLVVLSACRTAADHGLAHALIEQGIPAVIAMQLPWRDGAAPPFALNFYTALAGAMSVEDALQRARQALESGADWGVPTLYLAGDSSTLFCRNEAPFDVPTWQNVEFVGYERELQELHRALYTGSTRRAAVVGMGGVGKTEIALQYAHLRRADYPAGVFYVKGQTAAALTLSLAGVGRRHFNVSDDQPAELQAELTRRRLQESSQPALLICDDLDPETDLSILPAGGHVHVLATTRDWFVRRHFETIELKRLDEDAALALLEKRHPVFGEKEREAARAVIAAVDGHPKALALIASYLAVSFLSYVKYKNLYVLQSGTAIRGTPGSVMPANIQMILNDQISISFQKHKDLTKRSEVSILSYAACFDKDGISPDRLWEAFSRDNKTARRDKFDIAIGTLKRLSLVDFQRPRDDETEFRLAVHEVVRSFARGRLSAKQRCRVLHDAAAALARYLDDANARMDWRQVRRELPHCYAVADLCRAEPAAPAGFVDLLYALACYLLEHSDFVSAFKHLEEGRKLLEGAGETNTLPFARFLRKSGEVYDEMSVLDTAAQDSHRKAARDCAARALEIAARVMPADDLEMAEYHNTLGYVLKMQKRLDEALPHYRHALKINVRHAAGRSPGDPLRSRVASCLNYLGMLYKIQENTEDNLERARKHLGRALIIDREVWGPEHPRAAIRLNNLGQVAMKQKRFQAALEYHLQALKINEKIYTDANADIAASLYYCADAYMGLEDRDTANHYFARAMQMYERCFGDRHYMVAAIQEKLKPASR